MRLSRVLSAAVIGGLFVAVVPIQAFAAGAAAPATLVPARPQIYAPVTLTADLSGLTAKERQMLGLFIDAAVVMDDLFWQQAYPGDRQALAGLKDPATRSFARGLYAAAQADRGMPCVPRRARGPVRQEVLGPGFTSIAGDPEPCA